ncbi:MAG TPA: hypothetical protein VF702_05250 [Allosphingosinicella sp.]|jgi:hypothetical protein
MRSPLRALSCAAALLGALMADRTLADPVPDMKAMGLVLGQGRYLEAYLQMEGRVGEPGYDPGTHALIRSFVLTGAADYLPAGMERCADSAIADDLRSSRATDAVREIVRRARRSRIVILNEHHFEPRHRAFALQVARALRPLGYSYLAAEALMNPREDLAKRGFVVRSTGVYTNEPMFADFIREALAIGYRPVAYDDGELAPGIDRIDAREELQARNIAQRALGPGNEGKVLIYAGFSHATEVPFGRSYDRPHEWMAMRLRRLTGIDPLTIDQTQIVDPACLPPDSVAKALRANRYGDIALRRNGAPLTTGVYRGAVDLQVLHLPVAPIHRRAAWLTQIGRRRLAIPARFAGNRAPRLVQAFARGSPADAVPLDQVLLAPGETAPPPLMVPNVAVELRVQDPQETGE